ncbi:MAG: CPBP family intramembrane metalloprotease [Acidobacteria bacterium]|nr:CPBP family intramembrane metalloprotease [Acidobacteriota bacterium]
MNQKAGTVGLTLLVGYLIFIAAVGLPKFLLSGTAALLATQALELVLALGAIALLGKRDFAGYGFRKAVPGTARSMILPGVAALALGAAATALMVLNGGQGNPVARQLNFPQIVLFVWIFSSIIEEIFTRGFIQGNLASLSDVRISRLPLPVLISALFFCSMHLSLLLAGLDLVSLLIILAFTFGVGLLAGWQRYASGSLWPAVGIHFLANVGGMIGGIIVAIITVIVTGKPPLSPQ